MKKFSALVMAVCAALCCFALIGCGDQPAEKPADKPAAEKKDEKKDEAQKPARTLADWEGEWNNLIPYIDMPEYASTFEEKAKSVGKSVDEVKAELKERRKCEFGALEIKGDSIIFLDNFKDKGGKEIAKAEYKFVKQEKVKHEGEELEWDVFEATSKDAKYPVIIMMPPHGEEGLPHFHMRYGKNADELLKDDHWYPVLCKSNSTQDQLKAEFSE